MIPDGDMSTGLAYFSPAAVLDLSRAAALPHVHILDTGKHNNAATTVQWHSGNGIWNIKKVTLCQALLVLEWVTIFSLWPGKLRPNITSHPGRLDLLLLPSEGWLLV